MCACTHACGLHVYKKLTENTAELEELEAGGRQAEMRRESAVRAPGVEPQGKLSRLVEELAC